jgi:hypothetical protein
MSDDSDDYDLDDEAIQLAAMTHRLRVTRTELTRTIYAIQHKRRTPRQIRDLVDRARRLVHKSVLIRRTLAARRVVH